MEKDKEVLEVIKELAKVKGSKVPLTSVYRNVAAKGIYKFDNNIRNALKRLETLGKIKATGMNSIELLE